MKEELALLQHFPRVFMMICILSQGKNETRPESEPLIQTSLQML